MAIYSDSDHGANAPIRTLRTPSMHMCTKHSASGHFLVKVTGGGGGGVDTKVFT